MFDYFGKDKSEKYGEMISKALSGKTISKRKTKANEPGGLIYEATQLGIGHWDLLEALEGMCHEGKAREIDDSTYLVFADEKEIKYFEICFGPEPRFNSWDEPLEWYDGYYSICILGKRKPSKEEAEIFCKADMNDSDCKYIIDIEEISKKEAEEFFDMENAESRFPVFG